MSKRQQRKKRSKKILNAWVERRASKSKYAKKVFKREHGRDPDPMAESNAKKKDKKNR